jgi:hypothetical protein
VRIKAAETAAVPFAAPGQPDEQTTVFAWWADNQGFRKFSFFDHEKDRFCKF